MPFKTIPKLYSVWQSMKQRCYNPNSKQYADYGGRGISVCDRWINSYTAFEADMGHRPSGCSIDRINNDGDYSPENCRWATRIEQGRNKRNTLRVTINGRNYLVRDLSLKHGVKGETIIRRAKKGLPLEDVISDGHFFMLTDSHKAKIKKGQERAKEERTHCSNGHEYTHENTRITPQGWRVCRTCHRDRARKRAKRNAC